jgi:hypothetical protein
MKIYELQNMLTLTKDEKYSSEMSASALHVDTPENLTLYDHLYESHKSNLYDTVDEDTTSLTFPYRIRNSTIH